MSRDLDGVLSAIDGALADDEWPDAMRWSPEPEQVDDAALPFDGQHVTVGTDLAGRDSDLLVMHHATRGGVRWGATPGGMYRGPLVVDLDRRWAPITVPRQQGPAPDGGVLDVPLVSRLAVAHAAQHDRDLARLREVLALDPAQLARMGRLVAELGDAMRVAAAQVARTLADLAESLRPIREQLVDAGVLPDEGPTDPRERALWLRRNRNTGPQVPTAQAARRPRRHA